LPAAAACRLPARVPAQQAVRLRDRFTTIHPPQPPCQRLHGSPHHTPHAIALPVGEDAVSPPIPPAGAGREGTVSDTVPLRKVRHTACCRRLGAAEEAVHLRTPANMHGLFARRNRTLSTCPAVLHAARHRRRLIHCPREPHAHAHTRCSYQPPHARCKAQALRLLPVFPVFCRDRH